MSSRQPKRITKEEPHQKLDPREVKNRATASESRASREARDRATAPEREARDRAAASEREAKERINASGRRESEDVFDDFDIEEYVSYTDDYDDVRNYRKKSSGASTGRRVIGKILLYIQLVASILAFVLLVRFNLLSLKKLVIIGAVLLGIWLIIFITQRKRFNKAQAVGMVLSIILSVILVLSSLYLAKTNSMLRTVTSGQSYNTSLYDVVVRTDDSARTIQDLVGYTFAIQPSFRQDDLNSVISQIEADLGSTIAQADYTSAIEQVDALFGGEVNAVIYNDVFSAAILEQYEDFDNQVRVIKTYTVRGEADSIQAIDVDINSSAFLIYISGTDSEGEISMTGRSDVNIIAGINAVTKEILLISIPRDYYVEFPGVTANGSRDKLTHAGIYGMDELIATVKQLLGYDINYYVRVNFSSLMDIVDALGGIDIYNEQAFISHEGLDYPEGWLHLNGVYALHFVRERFAFEDGDFARGRNQVKVIQAMMDKIVSVNTLTNYSKVMTAVSNSVATNIPMENLMTIANIQINGNPEWHVVSYQLLGDVMYQPCQTTNGSSLSVDMPYKEAVENAQILLSQLFAGETLSEELQLTDNGQLTYVTDPV